MTGRDIIDRASITAVWSALGGGPLRHGRGVAWWRGGDGLNISLHEERGVWCDRSRGNKGGGVLSLVGVVLGCDRRAALAWLAEHEGVKLDDNPLSPAERRQWAQRRARAEQQARELAAWRNNYLAALREQRNALWDAECAACVTARQLLTTGDDDSPRWGAVWRHALDDVAGDQIDGEVQRVAALGTHELLALRERQELAA